MEGHQGVVQKTRKKKLGKKGRGAKKNSEGKTGGQPSKGFVIIPGLVALATADQWVNRVGGPERGKRVENWRKWRPHAEKNL